MNDTTDMSSKNLGTFAFLKPGWWVVHAIGIIVIFAIGYYIAGF